jgi:hypothetical protein
MRKSDPRIRLLANSRLSAQLTRNLHHLAAPVGPILILTRAVASELHQPMNPQLRDRTDL